MSVRRKYIRELAAQLLLQNRVSSPPVNVHAIANFLGLIIEQEPADEKLSGFILRESKRTIIGVNSNHHQNRQRFTIAHEIGHFLLHKGDVIHVDNYNLPLAKINLRSEEASKGVDEQEKEANLFAAELLIPKSILDHTLEGIGSIDLLNEEVIENLAKKYRVSVVALTFRLANLNYISL